MATGYDLDIDTDQIRQAAALLRQACEAIPGHPAITVPPGVGGDAAGASAQGRQAMRLALTRAEQSTEAAHALATMTGKLADRLLRVAWLFDEAEALAKAGG